MHFSPPSLALVLVACTHVACAWAADAPADPALPTPTLKAAPALTPPIALTPLRPGGAAPAVAPSAPPGGPAQREDSAIFLRADTLTGIEGRRVEAEGKVELRTRRETVLADWLQYDFDSTEIWGKGNVLMRRGFDWITGPEARYKRDTATGVFKSPRYYVGDNGGGGSAAEIRFVGPQKYEATDASYTTCIAPRPDWYIRIGELEVDELRKVGTGHHATLYFLNAPVAYTPWIEFPLSSERKSGFLTPILGSTGTRGLELATPYYLNLAPNYDATLTPRVMTKRGVQLGAEFRYLFTGSSGQVSAEDLPRDRVTDTNRYALAWRHTQDLQRLLPGLAGYWNLNKVSDDTYFADLADRIAITSQTTLPREGGFVYNRGPWQFLAREQAFQTLQDPTQPPQPLPYNRMPQLQAALAQTQWHGFDVSGTGEYVRFRNPTLVTGQRVYAYPTAAWTRQAPGWFVTARAGLHARHYDLDAPVDGRSSFDYAIPIASLDTGLVFERDWRVFDQDVTQTLEPRAFYVYIPYRDQSQVPAFDTAIDDYSFRQLFSENRYIGNDRIGDANQLTLALSSRFLDPNTGGERLRLAVGQRFYFADQRVTLNEPPRSASTSDLLIGADGRLTDAWTLTTLLQYNFDQSRSERVDAGFRYTPGPGRILSAAYRFRRQSLDPAAVNGELNQYDVAAQWPITAHWTALGRWNYSVVDRKTLEAVAGVEYNADCWVLRLVLQRLTTTTQSATTSVYLQIELNGLARFGTSPLDLLRRSVPGYLRTNDPAVMPRDRGDDFPLY